VVGVNIPGDFFVCNDEIYCCTKSLNRIFFIFIQIHEVLVKILLYNKKDDLYPNDCLYKKQYIRTSAIGGEMDISGRE